MSRLVIFSFNIHKNSIMKVTQAISCWIVLLVGCVSTVANLTVDPGETTNLVPKQENLAGQLSQWLTNQVLDARKYESYGRSNRCD